MVNSTEPRKLLIGELAANAGVTPAAIRHYERIALLPEPARTSSGYRIYGADDLERLGFICRAQRVGFTLDQIRQVLAYREQGEQPCDFVLDAVRRHAAEVDERIAELERLHGELDSVIARAGDEPVHAARYCALLEPSSGLSDPAP